MGSVKTFYYNQSGMTPVVQLFEDMSLPDDLPDEVLDEMLNAEADVIEPEMKRNAETMLSEKGYSTGATAKSITRRARRDKWGYKYVEIYFKGTRPDGKKATEIAFLNEYGLGKTEGLTGMFDNKIGGRFFIQKAIDDKGGEALDKAEKIFREWQDKK